MHGSRYQMYNHASNLETIRRQREKRTEDTNESRVRVFERG